MIDQYNSIYLIIIEIVLVAWVLSGLDRKALGAGKGLDILNSGSFLIFARNVYLSYNLNLNSLQSILLENRLPKLTEVYTSIQKQTINTDVNTCDK